MSDEPATEEVRAIKAFLATNSWEETRSVLEREQALLLTESVSQFLADAITHAWQSDDPEIRKRAQYLEAHLTLLQRAREVGIPAAWEEFTAVYISSSEEEQRAEGQIGLTEEEAERAAQDAAFLVEKFGLDVDDPTIPAIQAQLRQKLAEARQPPDPEQVALAEAMQSFLRAANWEETHALLERDQALLLSEIASQILALMVERAWRNDEEDDARYLEVHLKLLARARELGVEAAWAEFEAARQAEKDRADVAPDEA